ncbi:MAG: prepilin-type N-terminal cleavage/methylation domain-containing protein [Gemmatimonadota bacterium]|nr:MAG: prepilin-type N-terminal cleavage/methylation domain-containing protein [Gemmatimonadota bacterium]
MKLRSVPPRRGFTLVEVLVAMTLTGIVVAGTLRALSAQKKFYARQARILDARHAMRASATILASELRDASATGGDLYAIAPDSVVVRSTVGFAVACGVNAGTSQLSLTEVSGHFSLANADSALVFVENGIDDGDDAWRALHVTGLSTAGPSCAWGDPAEMVATINGSLDGVWIGAPIRLFQPYVYGLYQESDGRFWLGRREHSAASYVPVAGPLAPTDSGGLVLTYYDAVGAPTTNRLNVARIDIQVRAPTYRSLDEPDYRTLNTSTYLRNDG